MDSCMASLLTFRLYIKVEDSQKVKEKFEQNFIKTESVAM